MSLLANNAAEQFSARGRVTRLVSPSNFQVKGQTIDATQEGVVFVNGAAADLAKSVRFFVTGNQVINGAPIATQVTFRP